MREVSKHGIGTTDGLIAGISPISVKVGELKKTTKVQFFARGTLFAKSATGDIVIFGGENKTPYGILCDDVNIGTSENETTVFYDGGDFRASKVTVKSDYTLTGDDIEALSAAGIKLI